MTVFPRSNLNNEAVPWGRAIENAVVSDARRIEQLEAALVSENRASAGQMGSAGRQIDGLAQQTEELASRVTTSVLVEPVSVTTSSTTVWASASTSAVLPGVPGGSRHALISVSSPISRTGTSMAGPFVTVRFQGAVVFRRAVTGAGGLTPPDWGESVSTSFSAEVPSSGGLLQITLQAQLFVAGSGTAEAVAPVASAYFVDKV